jgi:phosphatidylglycerol:prolipoprotein diacylglycerol transferase
VGGVVGARLAFVIERWDELFSRAADPLLEVVNITSGGLIYYGGVVLAAVIVLLYLRLKRLPARRYLDIIAPSLMIGLAFGRMGCFLNGCCYGQRVDEGYAFAQRFPYASQPLLKLDGDKSNVFGGSSVSPLWSHQLQQSPQAGGLDADLLRQSHPYLVHKDALGQAFAVEPGKLDKDQAAAVLADPACRTLPVQPAQLFAMLNALLIAGLLLWYSRLRSREGQVFILMLILYPVARFAEESLRGDNPHNLARFQLTHNQYTSMILLATAVLAWLALRRLPASCGGALAQRQALVHIAKPQKKRKGQT